MRMNISVPGELAEKVRDLDLPISGICQKALSAAVIAVERRAALNEDIERVAARLRSTVDAKGSARREEGRQDGIEWAKDYATVDDLANLADGGAGALNPTSGSLITFKSAQLDQEVTSVKVDIETDGKYWDGFVSGATRVWEAVRDRL